MAPMPSTTRKSPGIPVAEARRRPGSRVAVLGGLLAMVCAAPPSLAAEWEFSPRFAVGHAWVDNIGLSPDGFEESDQVTEGRLGVLLGLDANRFEASLDYELQALWFADNDDADDVFHKVDARAKAELVRDSVFVDSYARLDQQTIDISRTIAYENLFVTGNRTDALVFGVSPYHLGRWGSWGESQLRYDYAGVRYRNTDDAEFVVEDADSQTVSGSLGSRADARGISWRASGLYTITEFDASDEFEYARAELDVGIPVGLRSRLTGTVGQESDLEVDRSKGGLDSSFWYVGFAWNRSELESLEARVGQRFFGTAYEMRWRRQGSRGQLAVEYTEEPTTSAAVLGQGATAEPGFGPGGVTDLDARVFVRKLLSANARYQLARSSIGARVYTQRRVYQDDNDDDEKDLGANLDYQWNLAPRTQLGLSVNWNRFEFRDDREDDLTRVDLSLTRDFTPKLSGAVRVAHFRRNSDAESADYRANLVALTVEGRF